MELKIYQVDAFAEKLFTGNPAAVCPLQKWLPDATLQQIAMENNLAETAFYVLEPEGYRIRWFTPTLEVDLCGHATLATAHVLYEHEGFSGHEISFNSRSGVLKVTRSGDYLTLNFPTDEFERVKIPPELAISLNIHSKECYRGKTDYMLIYENEKQIKDLKPNFTSMLMVDGRGVICTAKCDRVDFVSRFFAPQSGIEEDPVTGSAHTTLTPYWSRTLNKKTLSATQLSKRTGHLKCVDMGERVEISGRAKTYLVGNIIISVA